MDSLERYRATLKQADDLLEKMAVLCDKMEAICRANELMEETGGGLNLHGTGITSLPDNLTVGGGPNLRGKLDNPLRIILSRRRFYGKREDGRN